MPVLDIGVNMLTDDHELRTLRYSAQGWNKNTVEISLIVRSRTLSTAKAASAEIFHVLRHYRIIDLRESNLSTGQHRLLS